jgi:hypothetical protein
MGGGGAPRYRGPAPPHPLPPGYDPPPAYGPPTPTPPPFNPNGGRSKGKKRKVNGAPAAPGGAPAAPTPYNPWTGSIYMYPMGTGILGPRPGAASPRPTVHGFMASLQAAAPALGYVYTAAPYGYAPAPTAPYGYGPAPTAPYAASPSWDAAALINHLNAMSLQPILPSGSWTQAPPLTCHRMPVSSKLLTLLLLFLAYSLVMVHLSLSPPPAMPLSVHLFLTFHFIYKLF